MFCLDLTKVKYEQFDAYLTNRFFFAAGIIPSAMLVVFCLPIIQNATEAGTCSKAKHTSFAYRKGYNHVLSYLIPMYT